MIRRSGVPRSVESVVSATYVTFDRSSQKVSGRCGDRNMGQSAPGGPVAALRRSVRRLRPRRPRPTTSAVFVVDEESQEAAHLDVNSASEEMLMTLPGVSRSLARSIVDHRTTIGRFRRIDDLALVPGMGAEKLDIIRSEICIRRAASNSSSRTQSLDSIDSSNSSRVQIDINTSTVFQLQCINGLNQELAANIVDYRQKKGRFELLDDLIKVKGIDKIRLSNIKTQLSIKSKLDCNLNDVPESIRDLIDCTEGQLKIALHKAASTNGVMLNGAVKNNVSNGGIVVKSGVNGHRKTLSVPTKCVLNSPNGFSLNSVNDVFELLSVCSNRPYIIEDFKYMRNDKSVIRIASWNLHEFNKEKANNPGVREVICRTILENRLSILGFQDVLDEEALKRVCDDLNTPLLKRIIEWRDNSKKWQYCLIRGSQNAKNVGFIYEALSNNKIEIKAVNNVDIIANDADTSFNYGCIDFVVNELDMYILNVQLSQTNMDYNKTLLCEKIDKLLNVNKNIIIVGDFCSSEHVKDLATCYKSVIEPDVSTLVELEGDALVKDGGSSILVAGEYQGQYVGISGVIRSGLCHLAIPKGWVWGGPLSPHCPIWAEFYIN